MRHVRTAGNGKRASGIVQPAIGAAAVASWLGLALAACGGGTADPSPTTAPQSPPPPPQPVQARGSEEVQASVTRAGGTLRLAHGAEVFFPEGTVEEPTEVTFRLGAQTQVFAHREQTEPIGPILLLEPSLAAAPGKPIRLSAPLARLPSGFAQQDLALAVEMIDEQQRALEMGGVQTRWQYFPVSVRGRRVEAELTEVPGLRLQFLVAR